MIKRKHVETLTAGAYDNWSIESEPKGFRLVRYTMRGNKASRLYKSADDARKIWQNREKFPIKLR